MKRGTAPTASAPREQPAPVGHVRPASRPATPGNGRTLTMAPEPGHTGHRCALSCTAGPQAPAKWYSPRHRNHSEASFLEFSPSGVSRVLGSGARGHPPRGCCSSPSSEALQCSGPPAAAGPCLYGVTLSPLQPGPAWTTRVSRAIPSREHLTPTRPGYTWGDERSQ